MRYRWFSSLWMIKPMFGRLVPLGEGGSWWKEIGELGFSKHRKKDLNTWRAWQRTSQFLSSSNFLCKSENRHIHFLPPNAITSQQHSFNAQSLLSAAKGWMRTMPADFHRFQQHPAKLSPTLELASPHLRTRQKAGWGRQQVLFLKHRWENTIKRGKVHKNMKKRHSFFKGGSLSRSPSGRNTFQGLPRQQLGTL